MKNSNETPEEILKEKERYEKAQKVDFGAFRNQQTPGEQDPLGAKLQQDDDYQPAVPSEEFTQEQVGKCADLTLQDIERAVDKIKLLKDSTGDYQHIKTVFYARIKHDGIHYLESVKDEFVQLHNEIDSYLLLKCLQIFHDNINMYVIPLEWFTGTLEKILHLYNVEKPVYEMARREKSDDIRRQERIIRQEKYKRMTARSLQELTQEPDTQGKPFLDAFIETLEKRFDVRNPEKVKETLLYIEKKHDVKIKNDYIVLDSIDNYSLTIALMKFWNDKNILTYKGKGSVKNKPIVETFKFYENDELKELDAGTLTSRRSELKNDSLPSAKIYMEKLKNNIE